MILEKLKTADPAIHGMASTDGMVWLSPGLQGRIFCSIGDRLAHKLDFELAANPTDGFNNIGGNSLWPGPEGGAFAFNYPHGEWTVQDGINKVCPTLSVESPAAASMVKNISLLNAKGTQVELEYRRRVQTLDISSQTAAYAVKGAAYTEQDTFTPLREYAVEEIMELDKGVLRVKPDAFTCDAYLFYSGDSDMINAYRGEYMSSYPWASMTESILSWRTMDKG